MTLEPKSTLNHSNRIVLLDALRGFALFGLFIVHMVEYFELYWFKPEPGWVHNVVFFIFGGKAYAIFALLFGVSFFIIIDKREQRNEDFRLRFAWRLLLLGVLGYLHGLIYSGDILQVLAVLGLPLLIVYRLPIWACLSIAVFFLLQTPSIAFFLTSLNFPDLVAEKPLHYAYMGRTFEALSAGSFYDVLNNNAFNGQVGKWLFMLEAGRAWSIVGFAILGMSLYRMSVFERIVEHLKSALLIFILCSCTAWLIHYFLLTTIANSELEGLSKWILNGVFRNIKDASLAGALTILFIGLYHFKTIARLLNSLAACGRMSLTIYITQSLVCAPLFYGYGLGWYAKIGQLNALILGLILWLAQMLIACLWFRAFQYGPFEWIWRSATLLRTDIPFIKV